MGILDKIRDSQEKWKKEQAEALARNGGKKLSIAEAVLLAKLSKETDKFSKPMVVRSYPAKSEKLMESEGSILIDNGYAMQGQSGYAENKGTSLTSLISANRSKGVTTITFVKQSR
jgi:hypothetical protein